MATRESTVAFVLDQLGTLRDVQARKMFGEYALYYDGKVVGLVCDDQLFIKATAPGRALLGSDCEEGPPYPGAKPAFVVGADQLEDEARLCELVRTTAAALPRPKPKVAAKEAPLAKLSAKKALAEKPRAKKPRVRGR